MARNTGKRFLSILLAVMMVLSITATALAEPAAEAAEISLESIAQLNSCAVSDLNTLTDEEGYVTFVGNRLSDDVIATKEEAYAYVTEDLASLLQLGDITVMTRDVYSSPLTGMTYYRFDQTVASDIDVKTVTGEMATINANVIYMSNSVKLGVDTDGHPTVLVSDLTHEQVAYDPASMMTAGEAEEFVQKTYPGAVIYPDATCLTCWEDTTAANTGTTDSTALLVYEVYTDNPDAGENSCMPYICYEVDAHRPGGIVATMVADSLTAYSYNRVDNTTLSWFDDKEDKGEITYTINLSWITESDLEYALAYAGSDTIEVTVPVMYCETDGLYYLGEKEHYITMSNYYDFMNSLGDQAKYNPYVTENPEDLSSWHFKISGNEEQGCTYLDDPDYVISSFAEYVKVIHAFGETYYFFDSYPTDSYMLLTYYCGSYAEANSGAYPTKVSDFDYNAANGGRQYDWNSFLTSPYLGLCLDDVVMCHEFTHGVNSHFASAKYFNESGAVMESLADMVGYQVAATAIDSALADTDEWLVGGSYGPVFRTLGDPLSKSNPEYLNGACYVNPIDSTLMMSRYVDFGGVHINSGVPNYLGYMLCHGTANDGEEVLSIEDSAKMWFEALYLSNSTTGFTDLGAILKFTAGKLGLSDAEQAYLSRMIQDYGFADGVVAQELLDTEESLPFSIHLDYEDPEVAETYYFTATYESYNSIVYGGGFENNTDQQVLLPAGEGDSFILLDLHAQSAEQVASVTGYIGYFYFADFGAEVNFHVMQRDVASGEALTLAVGETPVRSDILIGALDFLNVETDEATGVTQITNDPGTVIFLTHVDGAADDEYNLYLACFE